MAAGAVCRKLAAACKRGGRGVADLPKFWPRRLAVALWLNVPTTLLGRAGINRGVCVRGITLRAAGKRAELGVYAVVALRRADLHIGAVCDGRGRLSARGGGQTEQGGGKCGGTHNMVNMGHGAAKCESSISLTCTGCLASRVLL